jgi:UDPglucose--hexose-1-phosphate uridylyltransferase
MSTLRQDPLTGRWVIMAAGRGDRPNEFRLMRRDSDPTDPCPFCPGNEGCTTPEILALGRDPAAPANGPGWRMRLFPNKFPALRSGSGVPPAAVPSEGDPDLFPFRPGTGSHEVIVYSPDHAAGLASLEVHELSTLLEVLRGRSEVLSKRPGHRYVSPFCNHGPEAGATLGHPHMQIIGTPEIPSLVVDKAVRFARYRAGTGRCLLCDLLQAERDAQSRVVADNGHWTALTPWASRFPWEMLLVPADHQAGLTSADGSNLAALAEVLSFCLKRLAALHGDLSLNVVFHSSPLTPPAGGSFGDEGLDGPGYDPAKDFHWHLEIMPRLSRLAGFEVGTGFIINSVIPETAAEILRAEGS